MSACEWMAIAGALTLTVVLVALVIVDVCDERTQPEGPL